MQLASSIKSAVFASSILISGMTAMAGRLVLYDSLGFELPTFGAGDLTGQDPVAGPWFHDGTSGSATVQAAVVSTGNLAVQVDRAAGAEERWGVFTLAPLPPNDIVLIGWDMRVDAQTAVTGSFGPFMGIEAYDSNATFALLGGLYVDATTSDLITLDSSSIATETGHQATLGSWHHYDMRLDFTNETYTVFQDNTQVDSRPFVDLGVATITSLTDAPIAAIRGADDSTADSLQATAYIDNYLITEIGCDFDADGDCDAADIDLLLANLTGTSVSNENYDLDGDSDADQDDLIKYVRVIKNTEFGDWNLDGSVDLLDLNLWLDNDGSGGWAEGDGNGDGSNDLADFNMWLGESPSSTAPQASLAPEPATLLLFGAAAVLALRRGCRKVRI